MRKYMVNKSRRQSQSGMLLLEGMIALLIFSFGILGLIGMQAVAVKQATDAKYRSDACLLTNQLFGTMWVDDRTTATMKLKYQTGGTGYATWLQSILDERTLPGVDAYPPAVDIDDQGVVIITIRWLAPNETIQGGALPAPHQYVARAQIR